MRGNTGPTGSCSHFNFSFSQTSTSVSITVWKHGKCFQFLKSKYLYIIKQHLYTNGQYLYIIKQYLYIIKFSYSIVLQSGSGDKSLRTRLQLLFLIHLFNFYSARKPENPKKIHHFQQTVDKRNLEQKHFLSNPCYSLLLSKHNLQESVSV